MSDQDRRQEQTPLAGIRAMLPPLLSDSTRLSSGGDQMLKDLRSFCRQVEKDGSLLGLLCKRDKLDILRFLTTFEKYDQFKKPICGEVRDILGLAEGLYPQSQKVAVAAPAGGDALQRLRSLAEEAAKLLNDRKEFENRGEEIFNEIRASALKLKGQKSLNELPRQDARSLEDFCRRVGGSRKAMVNRCNEVAKILGGVVSRESGEARQLDPDECVCFASCRLKSAPNPLALCSLLKPLLPCLGHLLVRS